MQLLQIDEPMDAYYAFDWLHGLLYYSEKSSLFVVNLKDEISETMSLYTSTNFTITGLVVRPDNGTLLWLEYEKYKNMVTFMLSYQVNSFYYGQLFLKKHNFTLETNFYE